MVLQSPPAEPLVTAKPWAEPGGAHSWRRLRAHSMRSPAIVRRKPSRAARRAWSGNGYPARRTLSLWRDGGIAEDESFQGNGRACRRTIQVRPAGHQPGMWVAFAWAWACAFFKMDRRLARHTINITAIQCRGDAHASGRMMQVHMALQGTPACFTRMGC